MKKDFSGPSAVGLTVAASGAARRDPSPWFCLRDRTSRAWPASELKATCQMET